MKTGIVLAAWLCLAAAPCLAQQAQEEQQRQQGLQPGQLAAPEAVEPAAAPEPVLAPGQETMGTLVDALTPKPPVRMRSIRIARDGAPATPPPPSKVSLLITFETNSATLTARSRQSLEVVGQALASNKLAPFRFAIEGHADPRGISDANLKLSQLRAQSVRSYLVDTMKVDPARLEAVGKGDREPMNKANAEAPENRRVTIVNLSR